jgi:hypothetical protein
MDLRQIGWELVHKTHVAQHREHSDANEPLDFIKCGEFLKQLCSFYLLVNDCSMELVLTVITFSGYVCHVIQYH